jgi:glucose/arabinose dehydrogenase
MFRDGAAAVAIFNNVEAMLHLPDGRVLVADRDNNRIRMLSADLQQVSTVAGNGQEGAYRDGNGGYRDGTMAQALFNLPRGLALLTDGRVLLAEKGKHHIRVLSADLQQVSTVAGGGERGHRDGAAAQAEFSAPSAFAVLPDGRVLVTDQINHCIRMLSADLQQVSTVAGEGEECSKRYKKGYRNGTEGYRDGASAQAQFHYPCGLLLLPDGRVLVADTRRHSRIRVLSADLQQVSTVAGDGGWGHRDGAAAQAQFRKGGALALLPDGRVLMADGYLSNYYIRVLSADLQQVSTLTNVGELNPTSFGLLPDGRLLVSTAGPGWEAYHERPPDYHTANCIRVLEGFSAALLSTD